MNETSSFTYNDAEFEQRPAYQQNSSLMNYKFTADEMRVMNECNTESFFKRSLPISSALGLGTVVAIQKGYLRPNARFGAFPKVTLAVIVGYFVGKVSYQQACAEKLMKLPGSYIGQLLRERKEGKIMRPPPGNTNVHSMFGAKSGDIYSDAGPENSLNLDTDRPLFSDDNYKPSEGDSYPTQPSEGQPNKPTLSYDDLRRKNRGEHADARQDPYRMEGAPPITRSRQSAPQPSLAPQPAPSRSTNKYGDVIE